MNSSSNLYVVVFSFCLVAITLWLSNVTFSIFFWLYSVVLEQNDDKRNKISKASVVVVLSWLFAGLMLRNAYTSNLFTYMALELNPSDLPTSFKDIVNSRSVALLTAGVGSRLITLYQAVVKIQNSSKETPLYKLSDQALLKSWFVNSEFGPAKHIRNKNNLICDLDYDPEVHEVECLNLNRIAYMRATGPKVEYGISKFFIGTLLFMVYNNRYKILDNNEMHLFEAVEFVVSESDNYLKSYFEKYLSWLVHSGIELVQKRYVMEYSMKKFVAKKSNSYD